MANIKTNFIEDGIDCGDKYVAKTDAQKYTDRFPWIAENRLWLWGTNSEGQIGDNTSSSNRSSPVQTVSGGTNWATVSAGYNYTGAIKTDGTLWTWGVGSNGRLGSGAAVSRSSPAQTIVAGYNWKSVSCGEAHMAAIKTDGTLWLWGNGLNGRLGNNATTSASSPIQTISAGTTWLLVACASEHTAAIKTDGTLWTWGSGASGRLGSNNATSRSSPAQTIAAGNNWKSVACGDDHMAAIKTDGTLWLWGIGTIGRLGDGFAVNRSSPVQTISGGTNWQQVACGTAHTAAIKTDGSLWLWGESNTGRLGDNGGDAFDRSSPVQTVAGGTNWQQVACGFAETSAIKTDGTLWAWGTGGLIGDNALVARSSPVQTVSGGTAWQMVSMRYQTTAAINSTLL